MSIPTGHHTFDPDPDPDSDRATAYTPDPASRHEVVLLTRPGCGSCVRVKEQIMPLLMRLGVPLSIVDVDLEGGELRMEFGDRLPVVLLDGEEFACWEVDNDELEAALVTGE